MRNFSCFMAILLACIVSNVFSQSKNAAPGMESVNANFTSLTKRPLPNVTDELLNHASAQEKQNPDFGILPLNAPCKDCYEVLSKRTETKRYFVKNNTSGNEFCEQNSYGEINYRDRNGFLREKDIHVYETNMPGIYASENQAEPVSIDLNSKRMAIKDLANNSILFNNNLELWAVDQDGKKVLLYSADWSKATIGSDGLRVRDIFPGITLESYALMGAAKTNFVIGSYSSLYNSYKWLVIKDNVGNAKHSIRLNGQQNENGLFSGDADIVSETNAVIAKVMEGVIYDNSRAGVSSLNYAYNENALEMYIDVNFLKASNLQYPITVDPLISTTATLAQASITGSQYNGSCNFTNSCNFNLVVNSPANATITDLTFSMSYEAIGLCYKMDGAMRIGYGGCVSPNQSGYYWFCNAIGGGMCNGNNISVFSDLSSCIPAPSCTPYPMTFTLQMFRSCYGSGGCTANCIRAGSPWVMNVFGKTLETLGETTTGNGTSTQSGPCSGSTVLNPSPSNGVGPYTYSWSPGGATTSTLNVPASSTTQTVLCNVTDACGVTRTATFTVNPNPSTASAAPQGTQTITCASNVTFTPVYTSGTSITNYSWTGPGIVGSANNASVIVNQAGVYNVTFTNSAGCSGSASYTAGINNTLPTASSVSGTLNCTNNNTVLAPSYTPAGGLSYNWTTSNGSISGSVNGPSVTATMPGTYQVTFTDPSNGCQNNAIYTVSSDTQAPTVSSVADQTLTCITQTANINPSYTGNGLSYSWTGPGITTPLTTPDITASQAGTYTVVATASNGCTNTAQYNIIDNSTPPTVSSQNIVLPCNGNAASISSTVSPAGTYTYSWSGPGIVSGGSTATADVNVGGTYTLVVTAASGCTASTTADATAQTIPTASSVTGTVTCTNPIVNLAPVYTPANDLTSSWTATPGTISGSTTNASADVTQGGTYVVVFTNTVTNCQNTATFTVSEDTQAPTISSVADQTLTCVTQTANINPSYTGNGLSYSWTGPGITTPLTTPDITASQAGTYTVVATASNGCTNTAQYNIIDNSTPPTVSSQNIVLPCNGNAASISSTVSPAGTYTYSWSGPGIVSGGSTATADVNVGGTYTLVVTAASGCTASTTADATAQTIPTASSVTGTVTCTNPIVNLAPVYTPANDLTYSWTATPGTISGSTTNASANVTQGGTYVVVFTNTVTNCQNTATFTVSEDTQVPTISSVADQTLTCVSQTANINPSYTGNGLSYSWTGPGITTPLTTPDITASQAGTYTVVATASNGCTNTAQYNIIDNSNPPTVSSQNIVLPCNGNAASISSTVSPAGTYTYSWSGPGIVSGGNTATADVNVGGTYTLVVTAASGCTASTTADATAQTIPTASSVTGTVTCTNPTVNLAPVYTPANDLTYSWTATPGTISGSTTNASANVTQGGTYVVVFTNTVTNCQNTATFTVSENTQVPTISSVADQTLTCVTQTAGIAPSYTGNGLSYSWSGPGLTPPVTTTSIVASQAGTYTVVATASNGCTNTAQYNIVSNVSTPTVSINNATISCSGNPVILNSTITPAGTYLYAWSGPGIVSGNTNASASVNAAGNYSLLVTSSNGCTATVVSSVSSSTVTAAFDPANASGTSPFTVNFTNQSTGSGSYAWSFGDGNTSTATNPSNTYLATGTYTVTLVVTDGLCTDVAIGIITVLENSMLEVPNVFTPNGDLKNDVFYVKTAGIKDLELYIYNRWGTEIHSSSGIQASWDGKNASEGTYFYLIKATGLDDKKYEKQGTVNVFK